MVVRRPVRLHSLRVRIEMSAYTVSTLIKAMCARLRRCQKQGGDLVRIPPTEPESDTARALGLRNIGDKETCRVRCDYVHLRPARGSKSETGRR